MARVGVRLSDAASDGWEKWAAHHGLTLAALLEAIGLELTEAETWKRPLDQMLPQIRATVLRAREIQQVRKRRK